MNLHEGKSFTAVVETIIFEVKTFIYATKNILSCLIISLFITGSAQAQEDLPDSVFLSAGKVIELEPEILSQARKVYIHLPLFFDSLYTISAKILWGHSFLGMFTTYVIMTNPGLFNGNISTGAQYGYIVNDIDKHDFRNLIN